MRPRSALTDPGDDVREALVNPFEGPDGAAYLRRLSRRLQVLPPRDSEWDVLASWARPSVLIAAMAAGLLLGLTFWRSWRERVAATAPAVSVAMLEEPRLVATPIVYTVMGER